MESFYLRCLFDSVQLIADLLYLKVGKKYWSTFPYFIFENLLVKQVKIFWNIAWLISTFFRFIIHLASKLDLLLSLLLFMQDHNKMLQECL